MNTEDLTQDKTEEKQQAVSGHVEPVVMLPCPFCGSEKVEILRVKPKSAGDIGYGYLHCHDCTIGMTPTFVKSDIELVMMWNKRQAGNEIKSILNSVLDKMDKSLYTQEEISGMNVLTSNIIKKITSPTVANDATVDGGLAT